MSGDVVSSILILLVVVFPIVALIYFGIKEMVKHNKL